MSPEDLNARSLGTSWMVSDLCVLLLCLKWGMLERKSPPRGIIYVTCTLELCFMYIGALFAYRFYGEVSICVVNH